MCAQTPPMRRPFDRLHLLLALAAVLAVTLPAWSAAASRIRLSDGTVLMGSVLSIEGGVVPVRTRHLGDLTIPARQVLSIDDAAPPALDETDRPATEGGEPPTDASPPQAPPAVPEAAAGPADAPAKDWSLEIDLGLTNVTGNTDEQVSTLALRYLRENPRLRWNVDSSYYLKVSDGEVTDNKFTAGARYDWLNPGSRWFAFAGGRYDFDEFESWDQRVSAHAGPGYRIVRQDDLEWNARVGPGVRQEFGSDNDDLQLEGVAATSVRWQANSRTSLNFQTEFFPVLTDLSDHRVRSTLNLRYRLNDLLALTFGVLHEYQAVVDPDTERNDLRVTLGVGLDF